MLMPAASPQDSPGNKKICMIEGWRQPHKTGRPCNRALQPERTERKCLLQIKRRWTLCHSSTERAAQTPIPNGPRRPSRGPLCNNAESQCAPPRRGARISPPRVVTVWPKRGRRADGHGPLAVPTQLLLPSHSTPPRPSHRCNIGHTHTHNLFPNTDHLRYLLPPSAPTCVWVCADESRKDEDTTTLAVQAIAPGAPTGRLRKSRT